MKTNEETQRKAELFDWLIQNANIQWDLMYENVEISFPLNAESFNDLQHAIELASGEPS